ncbi:M56 family peptidase [Paenibacillus sp. JMULE4]|uniref:M48 family metalloprotease n=1 Tax=Paenibacillus validus TaxID=44253 RepID=A0A7X2ZDU0_9BACL|nr:MULTISPECIES: M56 family metallopeptidase [Paenibacillus]MUG73041.1 M48 family metalloprotease [Paenibacillus validus]NTZ19489.1 M56 family peptidase [Paenibacillus sp. JMULE4]
MKKIQNPAEFAFGVFVAVACIIWIQLAWSFFHQFNDLNWIPDFMRLSRFVWQDFWFAHSFGEAVLTFISIITISALVFNGFKDVFDHLRWNRFVRQHKDERLSEHWNRKFAFLGMPILVIKEQQFLALTSGISNPKIILSTGLIQGLDEKEMEAVLLHEAYHVTYRHPIKKWLLKRLARVMFYIPVLKGLSNYYAIWIELLADRFAIERMEDSTPIASALVKMINLGSIHFVPICADFSKTAINYRLKQILDLEERQGVELFSNKTLVSSVGIGMLVTTIVIFSCL